jgi:hypothetical protein
MNIRKLAIILILLLLFIGLAYAQLTTSQIAKRYSPSVVTIVALDHDDQPLSLGSGFFINEGGDIATNHHVLEGSSKAIIKSIESKKGEILEIINDDPVLDMLVARTSFKNTNPIPLGDSDSIAVGEEIIAIGNPAGLEGTVSNGIISGIRKLEEFKLIQITAPISPGSSGGPVFNKTGKVIGIATAYLDVGQNLNFALPINYLKSLKPSKVKLSSLPKITTKGGTVKEENSIIRVFDVHYNYNSNNYTDLRSVEFAIKNLSNYPIRNIKIFFVYKNFEGEVVSYSAKEIKDKILPQLALQFYHDHYVRYFGQGSSLYGVNKDGEVEIRILDYQIERTSGSSPADGLSK